MKKQRSKPAELVSVGVALDGLDELFTQRVGPTEYDGVWAAEPQLYLLPFCVPQDRLAERLRQIRVSETVHVNGHIKHRSFRVNPDPDLGLPGTFDLDVMTGIYRLADEQMAIGGVPEYIELGSFKSFLALIGKPYSGRYANMVKESLRRLMATVCISEGFFYSKPRDLYIVESFTFISSVEIAGETDFNGNRFERTRVKLHEFIRENLDANFRTLIDFGYLRQLRTDIAKTLSLNLAYRMFKNKQSEWIADYMWLAERLAVKVHAEPKRAKEQFKPALVELKASGFIDEFEWLDRKKIRFVAGPGLLEMHKRRVEAKDSWLAFQQKGGVRSS
ncbi:MAG TPA: hypothetical protein V6D08_00635 [Candidatus Obscuribacterales bacterium]